MAISKKGQNLLEALKANGYEGDELIHLTQRIDGKREQVCYFKLHSACRNAFYVVSDIRVKLDEADIQKIASVAMTKGFLTFIDKDFSRLQNKGAYLTEGYNEWGFIFYPSHIIGRLKRVVSKTQQEWVEYPGYLQGKSTYMEFLAGLKHAQQGLLQVTKYALVDKNGDTQTESVTAVEEAFHALQADIARFTGDSRNQAYLTTAGNTSVMQSLLRTIGELETLNDKAGKLLRW